MPRVTGTEQGLDPHYKVRVSLPAALSQLASRSEPQLRHGPAGRLVCVDADWIDDDSYGDTAGYVDWSHVLGVTWRWSP